MAVLAVVLCAGGVASAQWAGPFDADQRIQYTNGRVLVGQGAPGNPRVLLDIVEPGISSGRDIAFHSFAGTPVSGIRTTAIWGETNNPRGRALQGFNFSTESGSVNNPATGVWAESASPTGQGMRARATSTTGASFAGYLDNASSSGTGIYATATSTSGSNIGVWGNTASPVGYAGYFTGGRNFFQGRVGIGTASPIAPLDVLGGARILGPIQTSPALITGTADLGLFSHTNGNWMRFVTNNAPFQFFTNYNQGTAALPTSMAMTLSASGNLGLGTSSPSSKLHVIGSSGSPIAFLQNSSSSGGSTSGGSSGVTGNIGTSSAGAYSAGVWGINNGTGGNGIGVAGYQAGSGFGVFGKTASASGFAGFFEGKVAVTGTLSKGGGSFKIDHPLDPENKYLYHSFVESPDMMNIYNGNVTTDGAGIATISMPDWFEALNRDFRYQLTVIDDAGEWTQARIFRKMDHGSFMIQTSRPYVEVSWQVTGVRHDKWADANRIPVEENKEPQNRGKYLHWREWGRPESDSVTYQYDPNWTAPLSEKAPAAAPARSASRPAVPTAPPRPAPVPSEPALTPAAGHTTHR